jgi:FMN phosphatase YigB (HAD superfamily)
MSRPVRVDGFDALRQWLEARMTSIRCVSFDVFDTLLARCIEPPGALQHRVAALLAERIGHASPEAVLQVRRAVEAELRHAALSGGMDHECHFDPLVEGWVARLVGHPDAALVEFVHARERELESLALSAKPGAAALLRWLRARGARVIVVSDMYLSHDHLAALLDACGLGGLVDRVYVSSEFGLGKYSGRLHSRVLELEGFAPGEVVHIGDNLVSDMHAPLRVGMHGVFLDERAQRLRRRRQTLSAEMAEPPGVWRGRRFFEIVDYRMEQDAACQAACADFFHHYGAHVLGPAFGAFLLGLIEKIGSVRPDKLFFLARDGYLFERMYARWRELEPAGAPWPEPVYVYASRRVVAAASVAEGLRHDQALVALYNPKQQGLLSVLKTFGLPAEPFAGLAHEHGFHELAERLDDWNDPRLIAFLQDERVQSLIRPVGAAARGRLQRYFEQQGFFASERVAMVDIGWNGTIQKFLHDSFGGRPDYPEVHGWYFAFVAAMHGDFGMGERIEGLIQDARRGDPYERTPMDFEEIFEQGARSGEGTTLGYADVGDRVVPVLKDDRAPDRQGEIACNPLIERFQDGVLDHLEHFHAAWRLTGYCASDIKPYVLALLERAVVYPTREEVAEISRLVHTEDFGHDHTLDIGLAPVRYRDLLRPRALYLRLRHQPWKFAAFAHFGGALPAWMFRLVHLADARRR